MQRLVGDCLQEKGVNMVQMWQRSDFLKIIRLETKDNLTMCGLLGQLRALDFILSVTGRLWRVHSTDLT